MLQPTYELLSQCLLSGVAWLRREQAALVHALPQQLVVPLLQTSILLLRHHSVLCILAACQLQHIGLSGAAAVSAC
jgi:hypothetical protein